MGQSTGSGNSSDEREVSRQDLRDKKTLASQGVRKNPARNIPRKASDAGTSTQTQPKKTAKKLAKRPARKERVDYKKMKKSEFQELRWDKNQYDMPSDTRDARFRTQVQQGIYDTVIMTLKTKVCPQKVIDFEYIVRIATKTKGLLQSSSMENDIAPLTEFIQSVFSNTDRRLRDKYPPYFNHFISFLRGMKSAVLTSAEKIIIETCVCHMDSFDRLMLAISLKRRYEGLSKAEKRKWNTAIRDAIPVNWDLKLHNIFLFKDVIQNAKDLDQGYGSTPFCCFRLLRDYCMHMLELRYEEDPDAKIVGEPVEKFKDDDGVELMVPFHLEDTAYTDLKINYKQH